MQPLVSAASQSLGSLRIKNILIIVKCKSSQVEIKTFLGDCSLSVYLIIRNERFMKFPRIWKIRVNLSRVNFCER